MRKLYAVLLCNVLFVCLGCTDDQDKQALPVDTSRKNNADAHEIAWVRGFLDGKRRFGRKDDDTWWPQERIAYTEGYLIGKDKIFCWYTPHWPPVQPKCKECQKREEAELWGKNER